MSIGSKAAPVPVTNTVAHEPNVAECAPELWRRRRVVNRETGAWVIDLENKSERLKVGEMLEPQHRDAEARGKAMQGHISQVEAVSPHGDRRMVARHLEAGLGRKGFRPAVYYGKARGRRIERWSDGLLYRETPNGGLECMNVCCVGTPIIPCKNPRCERCNEVAA